MSSPALLPYLVETCIRARVREARKRGTPVGRDRIARAAGVSASTLTKFETKPSWKSTTDKIVAGYAAVCGPSVGHIWREAVQRMEADLLTAQASDRADADLLPEGLRPDSEGERQAG